MAMLEALANGTHGCNHRHLTNGSCHWCAGHTGTTVYVATPLYGIPSNRCYSAADAFDDADARSFLNSVHVDKESEQCVPTSFIRTDAHALV